MDAQRALADGEMFVKNAEEELTRKILREDQLYFVDNQVEAIDCFLADTEDLSEGDAKVKDLREKLRALKGQLEKKSMEFMAQQEGAEVPEDVPADEMAEFLIASGQELLEMVDEALKLNITKVDRVNEWEDPLLIVNGFIADSEPYQAANPKLKKIRVDAKSRKKELEKRIHDLVGQWRQSDLAGGEDDDE